MYGDSQAEVGVGGNLFSFNDKQRHPLLFTYKDEKDLFFGGYSIDELKKFEIVHKLYKIKYNFPNCT